MTVMDPDEYTSPEESGLSALVTVAETSIPPSPIPPSPVPPSPVPPSPVPMPDGWTLPKVAALVGDIAQNMYDLPYILKKHDLTKAQYQTLEKNPFFQRALEAEVITWQGVNSIQKRLALEAAIAVESAMPSVAARMSSKTEPLSDVVALMKLYSEMAGVIGSKANPANATNSERVRIVINLGEDSMRKEASVVIDQQALPAG